MLLHYYPWFVVYTHLLVNNIMCTLAFSVQYMFSTDLLVPVLINIDSTHIGISFVLLDGRSSPATK